MHVTKKVLAPLILMILLAGAGGIMTAKEVTYQQSKFLEETARKNQKELDSSQEQSDMKDAKKQAQELIDTL